MRKIQFNQPLPVAKGFEYMQEAFRNGHTCGNGPFTKACCRVLQDSIGVGKVLLTSSCTHALEMTALLLRVQPGDQVVLPSFTFVSTANAFVLRGAQPIFCDVRPDTLNMDESVLEGLITPRTKVIVPVHYAGVGCEMDHILDIAARHNVAVVEDNAHGLFAKYRGRSLGTFGCLATQSFHETKNFNCGEGGALLINDPEYVERAEIIHEKGTDRTRFLRGQVDKYTWIDLGSSYLPSELQAAYLLAQMEMRDEIQEKRQNLWQSYYHHLNEWATANAVGLPIVPPHCLQAYHMFYLMMPSAQARAALSAHLAARDIVAASHYVPLHLSPMGMASGGRRGDCPVTENVSDRLLRLPLYYDLTESDLARIVDAVTQSSVASLRSS